MDPHSPEAGARRGGGAPGWVFAGVLFGVVLASLAQRTIRKPVYEWDLLGYVACAMEWSERQPEALHREAYAAVRAGVPAGPYADLTGRNPYRVDVAADAEHFALQLPFYRGRVAYVGALRGLTAMGLTWVRAAYAASLLGALVVALGMVAWLRRAGPPLLAVTAAILILASSGLPEAARLATPDALSAALLVLGAWQLLGCRRLAVAGVLFGLSLLARSDNAILAAALLLSAPASGPGLARRLKCAAPWLVAYAAILVALSRLANSYGWWTVFSHTFLGYLPDPTADLPPFSFERYAEVVLEHAGEWYSMRGALLAGYLALVALGALALRRQGLLPVALAVLVAAGLRFLAFPALWDRLLVGHLAIAGALAVMALVPAAEPAGQTPAADGS